MVQTIDGVRGLPNVDELAPTNLSRALEARRFSDPGLVEAATPSPLLAYRCSRNLMVCFGVSDPRDVSSGPHRVPGYLVCAHGRSYIQPLLLASACEQEGAELVLELKIPAGTPALWIAGHGDPSTINGADLLCLDNISVEPTGWREEFETTILELTVYPD